RHVSLGHHLHEFLHAPLRLEQAILHGMADPCESLQIGGVETEEVGLIGCFNDKAVGQFNHRLAPRFSGSLLLSGQPGRYRWALPSIRDSRAEAKESHEI